VLQGSRYIKEGEREKEGRKEKGEGEEREGDRDMESRLKIIGILEKGDSIASLKLNLRVFPHMVARV
jgi:hypothetical protein